MAIQLPGKGSERLALAIEASREAGRITLEHFGNPAVKVERKEDDSPVTIADRRAEEHLRQRIGQQFPNDGILGEEYPEQPGSSGYRWIIDPIDGTKSFIHGVPLYGTMVGVEHQGESIIGVIVIPALNEFAFAEKHCGAWHARGDGNPSPARVSPCSRLADGLFLTSEVGNFDRVGRRSVYDRLQAASRLTRTWGDCYGYLMVATGRAEVMVDPIVSLWDTAALQPIIEEAGGTLTDWQGNRTIYAGQVMATNAHVLEEVLRITRG